MVVTCVISSSRYSSMTIWNFTTSFQKQDGGIHPILCGEICRRWFSSLTVNTTPVRNEEVKFFTSTYDNFIQTTGMRGGVWHSGKILSVFYDNLDTSDPNDPEVIIKIDISNTFNIAGSAQGHPGNHQSLASFQRPQADLCGLESRWTVLPSHTAAHRDHCRRLRIILWSFSG